MNTYLSCMKVHVELLKVHFFKGMCTSYAAHSVQYSTEFEVQSSPAQLQRRHHAYERAKSLPVNFFVRFQSRFSALLSMHACILQSLKRVIASWTLSSLLSAGAGAHW